MCLRSSRLTRPRSSANHRSSLARASLSLDEECGKQGSRPDRESSAPQIDADSYEPAKSFMPDNIREIKKLIARLSFTELERLGEWCQDLIAKQRYKALCDTSEGIDSMQLLNDNWESVLWRELEGASLVTPMGAFYAFPDLSALDKDSQVIARLLLQDTGVAVVPGSAFGEYGEGHVRISYACSLADVKNGMNALKDYWRQKVR